MQELRTEDMTHLLVPDFKESDYYCFYHELLHNRELKEAAERKGYHIAFFPHPYLQPYADLFADGEDVTILGLGTDYREVYEESALFVTDYSSAITDAVYLERPVIYAQFDREQVFSGAHTFKEGYFDYERDGFGEVETTLEGVIQRMIEYIENDCRMKEQYRKRADRFFAFRDQKNCQRLYDKIMEEHP